MVDELIDEARIETSMLIDHSEQDGSSSIHISHKPERSVRLWPRHDIQQGQCRSTIER